MEGRITTHDLAEYIPAALARDEVGVHLGWQYVGDERLAGGIVADLAGRLARDYPDRPAIRTDKEMFAEFVGYPGALSPDGFVFHMGRCGSTVVSNALSAVRGAIVLGEPLPIANLTAPHLPFRMFETEERWRTDREGLIRGAFAAYGRIRRGDERRYFIKWTDTNTFEIDLFRKMWPTTPCLFVYREPLEVMASLMAGVPEWLLLRALPAAYLGLDPAEVRTMWIEEYCARLLGLFCSTFATKIDDRCALLNYTGINENSMRAAAAFFGCGDSEIDADALRDALRHDAKSPDASATFAPDGERKRRAVSDLMREMVARHAAGPFAELERLSAKYGLCERKGG